jgi:ribokinase
MRRSRASSGGAVVVVGSVNVDLVMRVARAPAAGETLTGATFHRSHGGKGANQAIAAARLGARVRFVGAVGDDDHGREATAALDAEAMVASHLQVVPGVPTGVAFIVVDASGENRIVVASGANSALDRAWVRDALEGALEQGGVMLLNLEIDDGPLLEAATCARRAGMRVILNAAPARPFDERLIKGASVLLVNEGEALSMAARDDDVEKAGRDDVENAARDLASRTGAALVVTLGREGAMVLEQGTMERLPGHLVDVLDATGAGDMVAGALAAELASGRALRESVELAMAAAALSVRVRGAREGMPDRTTLEAFLRARGRP